MMLTIVVAVLFELAWSKGDPVLYTSATVLAMAIFGLNWFVIGRDIVEEICETTKHVLIEA